MDKQMRDLRRSSWVANGINNAPDLINAGKIRVHGKEMLLACVLHNEGCKIAETHGSNVKGWG